MSAKLCMRCRIALHRDRFLHSGAGVSPPSGPDQLIALPSRCPRRSRSTTVNNKASASLSSLLTKPTWSVRSLLPPAPSSTSSQTSPQSSSSQAIAPKTLHHLLRLSALPQPATPQEEAEMLSTLSSQLHFVRAIQEVDTSGVGPLCAIRDETAQGLREQTIGSDQLKDALAREDVVGHARRPRRRRAKPEEEVNKAREDVEDWDVLGGASETTGRYFVVRSSGSTTTTADS